MLAHQPHKGNLARGAVTAFLAALTAAALLQALPAPASASTPSPPETEVMAVVDARGSVFLGLAFDGSTLDTLTWYRLSEDLSLTPLSGRDPSAAALESMRSDGPACTTAERSECFRPTQNRWGVDISSDGGQTWVRELALLDRQIARMTVIWYDHPPVTTDVAAVMWNGEPRVVVANSYSGIAMRSADGDWQRYDVDVPEAWDEVQVGQVSPISMPPNHLLTAGMVILHLLFAPFACGAVAAIVTGAARRRKREPLGYVVGALLG